MKEESKIHLEKNPSRLAKEGDFLRVEALLKIELALGTRGTDANRIDNINKIFDEYTYKLSKVK